MLTLPQVSVAAWARLDQLDPLSPTRSSETEPAGGLQHRGIRTTSAMVSLLPACRILVITVRNLVSTGSGLFLIIQAESLYRHSHSVIFDARRDVVSHRLDLIRSIAHSNSQASRGKQGDIINSIADGNNLARRYP